MRRNAPITHRGMKALSAGILVIATAVLTFWAVVAFIAIHFILKLW